MHINNKAIFYPLILIISLDNIASASVIPILIKMLYPSGLMAHNQVVNRLDNIALLTGFIFLLSPSYFFISPLVGFLSDIYDRKLILLFCLFLSLMGYSLLLFTSNIHGYIFLALLVILILNAGTSSMTIVQAAIADNSKNIKKSFYFSIVTFAMLPLYLAIAKLSEILLIASTNPNMSNIIIACAIVITLLNILILMYSSQHTKIGFKNEFILPKIFNKKIILLLIIFSFFEFGSSLYFENISKYITENSQFSLGYYSLLLLIYKLCCMTVGLFFIYPVILYNNYFKHALLLSLILSSIGILFSLYCQPILLKFIFMATFTIGEMIFIPTIWTLLSDSTPRDNQGLIMGIKGSIWSLTWSLGLILGNKIASIYTSIYPILLAIVFVYLSLIIFGFNKMKSNSYALLNDT